MEKMLIKTGIYSLVISFMVMTVGFKNSREFTDDNGEVFVEIIAYPDFFFNILRYSIAVCLLFTYLAFFAILIQKKTDRIVEVIKYNFGHKPTDRL